MPGMQAMVADLNTAFDKDHIATIDRNMLLSRQALLDAAERTIATDPAYFAYLKNWPVIQMEAIRAALLGAVDHVPRLPVTIAWTAEYDYKLAIYD